MITVVVALVLALISKVQATPVLSFPVNSQVPPIAEVTKPYQFTFSDSTFSSPDPNILYSMSNNPSWLHLDDTSRTISGTPDGSSLGAFNFSLVATDSTGSVSTSVTLIVSDKPGPGLGTPVSQQLPAFGTFSSPYNLLLYPSAALSISFRPDTFTNTDQDTIYYALCANNTPLPSWINFNPNGLSFTGTTPEFTSPEELPQMFGIEMTASDVAGFSGAVASFQIIIESHELTFGNNSPTIVVSPGEQFIFNELQTYLTLDGSPIQLGELERITAETPQWMSIDPQTLKISGTPPSSLVSQNFTVSAFDVYGDMATTMIYISTNSSGDLIQGTFSTLNATIGSSFNYTLDPSFFPESGTKISVELGNTASWLDFDPRTLALYGNVPKDWKSQRDELEIIASQGNQSQTQNLTIVFSQPPNSGGIKPSSSAGGTSVTTPTSISSPTTQSAPTEVNKNRSRDKIVAAAVVIPLVAILGISLALYWCISTKRRLRDRGDSIAPALQISRPFFWDRFANLEPRTGVPEKRPFRHSRIPSHAPEIETIRPDSARLPEFSIFDEDEVPLRTPDTAYKPRGRRMSDKKPVRVAAPSPKRGFSRQSKRYSRMSLASSSGNFPTLISGVGHGGGINDIAGPSHLSLLSKRCSELGSVHGLGHGKGSFSHGNSGPLGFDKVRNSWKNAHSESTHSSDFITTDSDPSNENRCNTLSSTLNRFPPPASYMRHGSRVFHESANGHSKRKSRHLTDTIRLVDDSGSDRLSYFKRRSRFPAPLFSAGPSSRKSSQYSTTKNHPSMHIDSCLVEQDDKRAICNAVHTELQPPSAISNPIRPQSSGRERKSPSFYPRKWAQAALRVKPSVSSMASSRQFESTNESEAQSEHCGTDLIIEEGDDEKWPHSRHTEVPNPLALHRVSLSQHMSSAMEGERMMVREGQQRPVSIENHSGMIRGRPVSQSMRGDLAFV